MQEKHLFEYSVIRIVPRVEREEFLNAGVIVYCRQQRFLQALYELNTDKLAAFALELDIEELEKRLHVFELVCEGGKPAGPIGRLSIAERFRWLTATRSTIIQTSPIHPGLCNDAMETLTTLFNQLVK
jgi:hypothetical protein